MSESVGQCLPIFCILPRLFLTLPCYRSQPADITDGPGDCQSVTLITSIVAQSIYHQIGRRRRRMIQTMLQVSPGVRRSLAWTSHCWLQSCLSAGRDSFDDKFSLLPGVSTPLDQNTVKHSLVRPSVLASLNRVQLLSPTISWTTEVR